MNSIWYLFRQHKNGNIERKWKYEYFSKRKSSRSLETFLHLLQQWWGIEETFQTKLFRFHPNFTRILDDWFISYLNFYEQAQNMNDVMTAVENYMKGEMQMSQVMDGACGMWKMKMHFQKNIGVATRSRDGKFSTRPRDAAVQS